MSEIFNKNANDLNTRFVKKIKEKYQDEKLQIKVSHKPFLASDENWFWKVIAMLDWTKTGRDKAIIKPVIDYLSTQSVERIFLFQDILSQKLYLLDGQAYAENIGKNAYGGKNHFSGDEFLYIRCAIVANGKKVYEDILKKPSKMIKNRDFSALLYLPQAAYEKKSHKRLERLPAFNYETFFNPNGWGDKAIQF